MPKRYWLFKSEPTSFSIEDLEAAPNQTDHWDGVRNYQARNLIRDDMQKGDGVLFYHSNCKPTGIAGVAEIVRRAYPDHTALDPNSKYFDPKASREAPRWFMVDVQLRYKLREIVPLATLKVTSGLEDMMLTQRGSRLSVQPVTPEEWRVIQTLIKPLRIR